MKERKFNIENLYKHKILKENCFICQGKISEYEKVYEDDKVIAFLDSYPPTRGYTLLATKNHFEDITEIPEKDYMHLQKVLHNIAYAIKKALNPRRVCILNSGDTLKHFHFHIIPMYVDLHNNFIDVILKKKILDLSKKEKKEIISKIKKYL